MPRGPETLTTAQILAQSSNVGAIKIGLEMGKQRFDYWVRKFGFGKPTGVDLPGEERGLVLPVDKYSGSSMGNLPIGQGLSVTPMQMAQAYAAIANGGILRSPRVVRRVDGKLLPEPKGKRIISTTTAAQLRTMLEGAFAPGGTASEVSIPGYKLAGKTGTANKIDPATGEYSKFHYIASFMGFAPALHPQAADRRDGRRAPGRDLRRRGRRAGLRQDRLLRPAVHAHPAAIGSGACCWQRSSAPTRPRSRSRRSPTTTASSRRARCSSACRASRATATTSPTTRSRAARSRSSSQRPLGLGVPEVLVDDVRAAMAPAAAALAGDPTARLTTVGITGTNGKTTSAFLVRALLEAGGRAPACSAR